MEKKRKPPLTEPDVDHLPDVRPGSGTHEQVPGVGSSSGSIIERGVGTPDRNIAGEENERNLTGLPKVKGSPDPEKAA